MGKIDHKKESNEISGALIAGIVGISVLVVFLAARRGKEEPLSAIGETISHVGQIFEKHTIEEPAPIKNLAKQIHKNENTISDVAELVALGINLWKKFKN